MTKEAEKELKASWRRAWARYKTRMEEATDQYKKDVERAWNKRWPIPIGKEKKQ